MPISSVALVFDNTARPETTGVYCLRALQDLVRVEHFLPGDLGQLPRQEFDLYLRIDDGLDYPWPADLRPCAWWAIDTHLSPDGCLARAGDFDRVFAAQRDGADRLRREGIPSASWLPLACDPEVHRRHEVEKRWDVCFVGNLFPGPRQELLDLLRKHFPNSFVGRCYFEEMARTYSGSRLVFNRSIRNDVNMRVFEALACGSLLLTNDLADNGQAELFRDGEHLATYADAQELLDRAAFYLAREELRERIAAAGRAQVLAQHTYRHRMERLLAEMDRVSVRASASPDHGKASASRPQSRPAPLVPGAAVEEGEPSPAAEVDGPGEEANPPTDGPSPGYFEFARPELLGKLPLSARRVLDVGCGAGRLGEALKARQPAEVVGIELSAGAARAARARLDEVLVGDVEQLEPPFPPGSFDAVVCGDILEHLREPGRFLRRVRAWLHPGALLVASIPNARHHSVVRMLLAGNWTYEPAGLLDRTHLRFFTLRSIRQLLRDAGFTPEWVGVVPGSGYEEWQGQGRPGEVRVGGLHLPGLTSEEAEEFYVYQYLVTAVPADDLSPPAGS